MPKLPMSWCKVSLSVAGCLHLMFSLQGCGHLKSMNLFYGRWLGASVPGPWQPQFWKSGRGQQTLAGDIAALLAPAEE